MQAAIVTTQNTPVKSNIGENNNFIRNMGEVSPDEAYEQHQDNDNDDQFISSPH